MIHGLRNMIGSRNCSKQVEFDTGRGTIRFGWARSVPLPFYGGLLDRISDAWAVITERAFAVRWPEAGELERALAGCTCHPDDKPPVPCAKKYALTECRAEVQRAADLSKSTS